MSTQKQYPPFVIYAADMKQSQSTITVTEVMAAPAIQRALKNMRRWTPQIKAGVAAVLSNRVSFVRTGETGEESNQFDLLISKVEKCMKTDRHFAQLMDPNYVIVDFGGSTPPVGYRGWLEAINADLGGAAVGAAGPGKYNVVAGKGDQPISLVDPGLNNLNFLHINTKNNADYVASQLLILGGLSAWVLETTIAPSYR